MLLDFSLSEHEDEVENDDDEDDKKKRRRSKKKVYGKKPAKADGTPKVKKPYVKKVVEPGKCFFDRESFLIELVTKKSFLKEYLISIDFCHRKIMNLSIALGVLCIYP